MAVLLTEQEISEALGDLAGWKHEGDALVKECEFANFVQAFAFMTRVAMRAEKIDHHPDWSNSYNRIHISLTSHYAGGLTSKDLALAAAINRELSK